MCNDNYRDIRIQARIADDGKFAFVYLTSGGTATLDLSRLTGDRFHATWISPRDGLCYDSTGSAATGPSGILDAGHTFRWSAQRAVQAKTGYSS